MCGCTPGERSPDWPLLRHRDYGVHAATIMSGAGPRIAPMGADTGGCGRDEELPQRTQRYAKYIQMTNILRGGEVITPWRRRSKVSGSRMPH